MMAAGAVQWLRRRFITGFFVTVPLVLSAAAIVWVFGWADRLTGGFKLTRDGKLLPGFIDYLEQSGSAFLTSRLAVAWATQPHDVHPAWWAARLVMVTHPVRESSFTAAAQLIGRLDFLRAAPRVIRVIEEEYG